MRKHIFYIAIFIFFDTLSFNAQIENDTLHYIFLGHIQRYFPEATEAVDLRIEGIDYSTFDRVWLGGDIAQGTGFDYEILEYVDNLFDVSNQSNAWAFGNHDLRNFNEEWLHQITGRKTYYAHSENGITTIVLNLAIGPDDCEKLNDQFELIENVVDTIQESTHLILLSHHNIWIDVPGLPSPEKYSHSNQIFWIANCYDRPATYIDVIYPLLLRAKDKGITVINILGDTGHGDKGRNMVSSDGVYYIASGIDQRSENTVGPDRVLILDHIPQTAELTWKFHDLDSLYESFQ